MVDLLASPATPLASGERCSTRWVDLNHLAERVGPPTPTPFGQSPFAIGQGNRFEARIKENDHAALAAAINELLGIFEGVERLRSVNLERVGQLDGRRLIEARADKDRRRAGADRPRSR